MGVEVQLLSSALNNFKGGVKGRLKMGSQARICFSITFFVLLTYQGQKTAGVEEKTENQFI